MYFYEGFHTLMKILSLHQTVIHLFQDFLTKSYIRFPFEECSLSKNPAKWIRENPLNVVSCCLSAFSKGKEHPYPDISSLPTWALLFHNKSLYLFPGWSQNWTQLIALT